MYGLIPLNLFSPNSSHDTLESARPRAESNRDQREAGSSVNTTKMRNGKLQQTAANGGCWTVSWLSNKNKVSTHVNNFCNFFFIFLFFFFLLSSCSSMADDLHQPRVRAGLHQTGQGCELPSPNRQIGRGRPTPRQGGRSSPAQVKASLVRQQRSLRLANFH